MGSSFFPTYSWNTQRDLPKSVDYCPIWFFLLLWIAVIAGTLWFSIHLTEENHLFAIHGRHVPAEITDKWTTVSHGRGGSSTNYHLQYAYTGGDYRITDDTTTSSDMYGRIDVGDRIPVIYLPEKPSDNRIDSLSIAGKYQAGAIFGFVFAAGVFGLGGWGLRSTHNQNRIFTWLGNSGARCQGEVTRLVEVNTGKGGIRTYLELSFRTQRGKTIEGRSGYVNGWGQESPWAEGDSISVFYNPDLPGQFALNLRK
jgi:hypothetical protein